MRIHPFRSPISLLTLALLGGLWACHKTETRRVYFGNLSDGEQVTSPFKVEMKAEGLVVEPASQGVTDGHGHFHIIIDAPVTDAPNPIPKDAHHLHFGKGDTVTTLDLPLGEHTLTLQFAKGNHVPYDPQIEQQIHITVTKQNAPPSDSGAAKDTAKTH